MSERPRIRLNKIMTFRCARCRQMHRVPEGKEYRCTGYWILPLDLL